jgi:dimethylargininase
VPIVALTREVSPAIGQCELTHLARSPVDVEVARAQHRAYEHLLASHGCVIQRLGATTDMPDSVFVEDTAIVFEEIAIITRPGAPSRRLETAAVADAISHHRPIRRMEEPATLDGGDVLCVGRTVFVGRSGRTNDEGIRWLRCTVRPLGYEVRPAEVDGCLHLKSAVTAIADRLLLANRRWIPTADLSGFDVVDVDPHEEYAANALRLEDRIIYAAAFPRTLERLRRRGIDVDTVDVSELAKAEGAVTCCSVLIPT